MSTEASYALQQELYGLYREYYHSGQVVLCDQDDFKDGTVRITEPGLYVLTEDIVFDPADGFATDASGNPEATLLGTGDYADQAYKLGFFAAITVETDGVILDLQGHTIRQSYAHYFRQRFFNVIQLATSPFIPGQGPGAVRADGDDTPYKAASRCLILNGTIGLSSHGGIHGNNNTKVMLQKLTVRDFETTGVQLNGIKTAFADNVTLKGIACAPVASQTFSLVRHYLALRALKADTTATVPTTPACITTPWTATDLHEGLDTVVQLLLAPFAAADAGVTAGTAAYATTDTALATIWTQLCTEVASYLATFTAPATPPVEPTRFVNHYPTTDAASVHAAATAVCAATTTCTTAKPLPDGSAMVGLMCNCTGVAVNEVRDVCPANGQGCCAAGGAERYATDAAARRHSECVTLNCVTVERLHLRASESLGFKHDGDKFVRDFTGAVLDVSTLRPGDGFEQACTYVSMQKGTSPWSGTTAEAVAIQTFVACETGDGYPDYAPLHTACPNAHWVYNIDIMAHVNKGVFGLRLENVKGLTLEGVQVKDLVNASAVVAPRYLPRDRQPLPSTVTSDATTGLKLVSAIASPLDQTSALAHGGADIRGVFVGQCQGTLITKTSVSACEACAGLVRALEVDDSTRCGAHTFTATALKGLHPTVAHIHSNCKLVHLREVKSTDAATNAFYTYVTGLRDALEEAEAARDLADPTDTAAVAAATAAVDAQQAAVRALLRVAVPDPAMVHQELPGCVSDLRL